MTDGGMRWLAGAAGIAGVAGLAVAACGVGGGERATAAPRAPRAGACDTGGLSLPPGFCATVFADGLGHARHMAVRGDGTVYVNIQSGRVVGGAPAAAPGGGYLVALKDSDGDGRADKVVNFGPTDAGGTGVGLYKGWIYAETADKIVRYALPATALTPTGPAETVVSGLPLGGDHPMHPFAIDAQGTMLVDVASATNSCQSPNRRAGVPGAQPCTELLTRAGVWRYDANALGQAFSPAARYATGIRNGEGIAFAGGRTFATQHGRDQLKENWGALYPDAARTLELPTEELIELKAGGDYGWPYCYHDGVQKKLVLAPEYGGDGGKAVGVCAQKTGPVAAFPAHWGPNALAIYAGQAFPRAYRGGAFIAFHGSWNRAPAPQGGFNVVFQPLRDGRAAGDWVVFADGFAGPGKAAGKAEHRPTGLAMGPDGALYISDDSKGRIWRVTYRGPADAPVTAAAQAASPTPAAPTVAPAMQTASAVPPGSSAAEVAAGERVYKGSTCAGCHGGDGGGSAVGPSLVAGPWLWGGSLPEITASVRNGVPQPKQYRSPMPPLGGASLSDSEVKAVSAYVWSIGRGKG